MSRAEMIKRLPTPTELQQSAQQLQESINQAISQIQAESATLKESTLKTQRLIAQLPESIAAELSNLARLAETLDQSMSAQRNTLAMTVQKVEKDLDMITDMMKARFEAHAEGSQAILSEAAETIKKSAIAINKAKSLPEAIDRSTNKMKGQVWKASLISGLVAAVVAVALSHGIAVLSAPAPLSAQPSSQHQSPVDPWEKLRSQQSGR